METSSIRVVRNTSEKRGLFYDDVQDSSVAMKEKVKVYPFLVKFAQDVSECLLKGKRCPFISTRNDEKVVKNGSKYNYDDPARLFKVIRKCVFVFTFLATLTS